MRFFAQTPFFFFLFQHGFRKTLKENFHQYVRMFPQITYNVPIYVILSAFMTISVKQMRVFDDNKSREQARGRLGRSSLRTGKKFLPIFSRQRSKNV